MRLETGEKERRGTKTWTARKDDEADERQKFNKGNLGAYTYLEGCLFD
jgi:hypothetical protein